jgi:Cd2+/Zn2+-exporting ATPase
MRSCFASRNRWRNETVRPTWPRVARILMHDKIENVEQAVTLSRRARLIIRQNITISLGVVLLLVTSALLEKINLTVGVIGHEGSTVIVILNGLGLLLFYGK